MSDKIARLPTHLNPDSVLEQAIGNYDYVVLVGVNKEGEIDFREGGNGTDDLAPAFMMLSKVAHKIMNGDYGDDVVVK